MSKNKTKQNELENLKTPKTLLCYILGNMLDANGEIADCVTGTHRS